MILDDKVDLLNTFFEQESEVRLLEEFSIKESPKIGIDGGIFIGKVVLDGKGKEDLQFNVKVPISYPFTNDNISIRFCCSNQCSNQIGLVHQNDDNSICIKTPKHHDFQQRLRHEIVLLKEWRDRYYLNGQKDARYEYLITPFADQAAYFFTDFDGSFQPGDWGVFNYAVVAYNAPDNTANDEQAYILKIGNYSCQWADWVHKLKSLSGLYVFIGSEPVVKGKKIVMNWSDLEQYLSQDFMKKLYDIKREKGKNFNVPILIGYFIPEGDNGEIHWQLIKVLKENVPVGGEKIAPKTYRGYCDSHPIHWSKTVNCSYHRYFGRGRLTENLTEARILILGVGAIGSSLASILARAGCKYIDLCDKEFVEPGNICRSEFTLLDSSLPKAIAMMRKLQSISPHVTVKIIELISKRLDSKEKVQTRKTLESYDYIFDCTADTELSYVLDHLKLDCSVINLSVSNEANELACVVGGHTVTTDKNNLFKKLNSDEPEMIYEGTGCWSPTFRASVFDINSALHLAVRNINRQLKDAGNARTFIITQRDNGSSINLKTIEY